MRTRLIAVGVTLSAATLLPAAPAHAYPSHCTATASGVDARDTCQHFGIPWPFSGASLYVEGYGFVTVTCSGLQVVNSGVKRSGYYTYSFINPGGTCTDLVGANGFASAHSN